MSVQLSTTVRNGRLDSVETTIGTSAVLKIFTGSPPVNCAAADTGTTLATLNLPADYMANAAAGSKAKSGTWQDASADNSGTAGYFRMYDSGVTACHMQGTVGTSGTDMIVDSVNFNIGQTFTINSFTLTDGNA